MSIERSDYVNNKVEIISYKHNGVLHRVWQSTYIVRQTSDMLVIVNDKANVIDGDGRRWKTKEPAVCYFFKKYWFNIICMLRGNAIYYYCNLSSPYVKDSEGVKYIDYDLDLRVFADETLKILDKGEYKYHKNKMNYPASIDKIVKDDLSNLIEIVRKKEFPFNRGIIDNYYNMYNKLKKNC